jgi:hypothetical protein
MRRKPGGFLGVCPDCDASGGERYCSHLYLAALRFPATSEIVTQCPFGTRRRRSKKGASLDNASIPFSTSLFATPSSRSTCVRRTQVRTSMIVFFRCRRAVLRQVLSPLRKHSNVMKRRGKKQNSALFLRQISQDKVRQNIPPERTILAGVVA